MGPGKAKIRVLLADDSPQCLHMLAAIVARECEVVAMAQDGTSALELIRRHKPDVAILDFDMPGATGLEIIHELVREAHQTVTVICSVNSSAELVSAARDAGAFGFVAKQCSARDLLPALDAASRHDFFFPAAITSNGNHR